MNRKSIGRWIPAVGDAALIFILSAQPNLHLATEPTLDFILHKVAHLIAYAVLGWLVARAIDGPARSTRFVVAATLLVCIAYAATDEFHQSFVPGRGPSPRDVAIDGIGACIGLLGYRLTQRPGVDSAA
jgi:VanZ family protein